MEAKWINGRIEELREDTNQMKETSLKSAFMTYMNQNIMEMYNNEIRRTSKTDYLRILEKVNRYLDT